MNKFRVQVRQTEPSSGESNFPGRNYSEVMDILGDSERFVISRLCRYILRHYDDGFCAGLVSGCIVVQDCNSHEPVDVFTVDFLPIE